MAAGATLGPWAEWLIGVVAVVAVVAGVGTLNGWILMAGRISLTAARDGIFFRALGRVHPRFGRPHVGLIVGCAVSSAMLLLYFQKTLLGVFNFIVPAVGAHHPHPPPLRRRGRAYAGPPRPGPLRAARAAPSPLGGADAFVFVLYTIYGVGASVVLWGFLMMLAGIPLYIFFATRAPEEP